LTNRGDPGPDATGAGIPFEVGQKASVSVQINNELIARFADLSGDDNPVHTDQAAAESYGYHRPLAHGALTIAFLSRLIGTELPGHGALWLEQSVKWHTLVYAGDRIDLHATVTHVSSATRVLNLDITAVNQRGETVMSGTSTVQVPNVVKSPDVESGRRAALITGASRGIGAAIAGKLSQSGYDVAINCRRSKEEAEAVLASLQQGDAKAGVYVADVSDPKEVAEMVVEVEADFGRLDIVVHGASPAITLTPASDVAYADFEALVRAYVGGALALASASVPGMRERGFGRFVFLGTSYLLGPPPVGQLAYVAAKSALWGLVKSFAVEYGRYGITTNMVSPSVVSTEFARDVSVRSKELLARSSSMRRLASVEDAAGLVQYLASDEAGYINGTNVPLVGGPV
jgi:3-oxoacyl-[acyl-carrier protein] reductase